MIMKNSFLYLRFWALISFLCLCGSVSAQSSEGKSPKYIFYLIIDGCGVNTVLGGEMYQAALEGKIGRVPYCMSQFPVVGVASTHCTSHGITDSAASGTALATGYKTDKGMIGVTPDSLPVTSIAVKAKQAGWSVGVASSVNINHATPSAFYAHSASRNSYYEIGQQAITAGFDFYGGSDIHMAKPRNNQHPHLYDMAKDAGYVIARGYNEYLSQRDADRLMLFQSLAASRRDAFSLPYYVDADTADLTILQIMQAQIDFLSQRGKDTGFFLMNEIGAKVDFACHVNDAATAFREMAVVDSCVRIAYDFYLQHPDETLIVITADHETGGLVLGSRQTGYDMNLKVLSHQRGSLESFTRELQKLRTQTRNNVTWEQIQQTLMHHFGYWKDVQISKKEEAELLKIYEKSFKGKMPNEKNLYSENEPLAATAVRLLNAKACLSWGTGGHSAGLVPVYAIGVGASAFSGHNDNAELPIKIAEIAGW